MNKIIILLIGLLSFAAHAKENSETSVQDLDIKNLTDDQIRFEVFDFKSGRRWQETLAFCETILEQKPLNPEAHLGKGKALGKHEEAIKSYNLAIKYKRNPLGEVYYEKGMALEALKKFEEALKAYDLAIENNLDDRHTHYAREGVLLKLGRLGKGG